MQLGGYSISKELYAHIISNHKIVLELGSGVGTELLSDHCKMHSIEHDKRYVGKYNSTYYHAPIVRGWYDVSRLHTIPKEYDCLLIDGPPGS